MIIVKETELKNAVQTLKGKALGKHKDGETFKKLVFLPYDVTYTATRVSGVKVFVSFSYFVHHTDGRVDKHSLSAELPC